MTFSAGLCVSTAHTQRRLRGRTEELIIDDRDTAGQRDLGLLAWRWWKVITAALSASSPWHSVERPAENNKTGDWSIHTSCCSALLRPYINNTICKGCLKVIQTLYRVIKTSTKHDSLGSFTSYVQCRYTGNRKCLTLRKKECWFFLYNMLNIKKSKNWTNLSQS